MEKKQLTPYLQFGERVRIDALDPAGRSVFGPIDQAIRPLAKRLA